MFRSRTLRLTTVLLAALALAAGCSSDDTGSADTTAPANGETVSGAWEFTDDRGTEIALEQAPQVIVASPAVAGALAQYGIDVAGVLGATERMDGTPDPALGDADVTDMVALAPAGQLNVEQLLALQPDIVIAESWGDDTTVGLTIDELAMVEQQVPVATVRVDGKPLDDVLSRFGDIAVSIKGDTAAAQVAEGKAELEAATARLSEAANNGVTVLAASGSPTELYVARPEGYADLTYFRDAGVQLVEPTSPVGSGPAAEFWETLSWEEATRYPADFILADARFGGADWSLDQLPDAAQRLPAFVAEQVAPWELAYAFSYQNFAGIVDRLAESTGAAKPLG